MNHRLLAALAALVTVMVLLTAPMSAQAPAAKASAKVYVAPRTPDGQPDLQGVWSNATSVPLERPKELGSREYYTEEEYAKLQAAAAARQEQNRENGRNTTPGTVADVHYDLSQFGLDIREQAKDLRTSLITGPEGRVPPMIPAAQKRLQERAAFQREHGFDGPENRGMGERCIYWPSEGPPMLSPGYNSDLEIVQGPGYVAIEQEMIHDVRVIPTDNRPHLPSAIRQWFGNSVGHWEGDTLVVETTNFNDRPAFRNATQNLRVVERFTRTGPDTIKYEFTVSDPSTWEKSWSAEVLWTRSASNVIYEYACQEGNYGMANILSGVRASEKKAAEKAAQVGSK
jgi:hypothetical protein